MARKDPSYLTHEHVKASPLWSMKFSSSNSTPKLLTATGHHGTLTVVNGRKTDRKGYLPIIVTPSFLSR